MVFGTVSSPGIYDDLAKVILGLVLQRSDMDKRLVQQHLDDVVAVAGKGGDSIWRFDEEYTKVAKEMGVKLASRDDPDKSFGPQDEGKVLGLMYNLKKFTWWIDQRKYAELMGLLDMVVNSVIVKNELVLALMGKINHMMWVVEDGPWQRGFLMKLGDSGKPGHIEMVVSALARKQADWWMRNLRAAVKHSLILDTRLMMRSSRIRAWCDAAGGVEEKVKNGVGGVIDGGFWWYCPWPQNIRGNYCNRRGVRFAHKSVLEGVDVLYLYVLYQTL